MKNPRHLRKVKGSNNWQLQLKLPIELQNEKKSLLHRESLGTANLSEAKKLRDQRVGELRTDWDRKIAELNGEPYITRTELRKMVYKVLPPTNTQLQNLGNPTPYPVRQTFAQLQEELSGVDSCIDANVSMHLAAEGIVLKSEDRAYFERHAKNYYSRLIQIEIDELFGKAPSPLATMEDEVIQPESFTLKDWNTGIAGPLTFPEAIMKYKRTEEWLKHSAGTQSDYGLSFEILERCFSRQRTIGTLLPEDYDRIRNIILSMPKGMEKVGDIDRLVANIPMEKRLAPRTVNKHFSAINKLFKWLKKKGYLKTDMASPNLTAVSIEDRYIPKAFDKADLKKIFIPRGHDYMWWIPMIGLHSGARKNEICQLGPEDVFKKQGIWCFRITNQGEKNSTKTQAGNRIVPIHSNLLKAGFIEFWEEYGQGNENGRLFKEMKWSELDNWVRPFNRNFDYKLRKMGIKPEFPYRKGFHSFRYLVANMYHKAKADPALVDAVMGWTSKERKDAEEKMRELYAGRAEKIEFPVKKLQKTVELLKYDWLEL